MSLKPKWNTTQVEHNTSGTHSSLNTLKHIHYIHCISGARTCTHAHTRGTNLHGSRSGLATRLPTPPPRSAPPKMGPHEKWNPRKMEICLKFRQKSVGIERTALPVNMMPIIELTVRQLRVCRAKTYFAWEIQYMP